MDYTELAKRLREPLLYGENTLLAINAKTMLEAADAIEALTSPPDEAQKEAMAVAYREAYAAEKIRHECEPSVHCGPGVNAGLNAAYRIRAKKEAT